MRRIFPVYFLTFFFLSSFSFSSFAQSQSSESPAPAKTITAIEVKGNKAISTNTIVSKMKSRIGSPYQEAVASEDLKRLYLLGFFSDIKIDTEPYKDGIKIIVSLAERPLIENITFSGITRITMKDEKLKGQLKSKEGQYLDYPNLDEDARILKKMYERMGFSQAEINYKVDLDKERNKAKVLFSVLENKRVRIRDILFEGNKNFTAGRLLRLLKTKQAWFFNSGVFKDDVLKEDMDRLKDFYRKNGFSDVAMEYNVQPDAKKPYLLHIYITLREGKKYLVGNVKVQGNKDIAEKDILARLKSCTPGKVFSQEALKEDVSNIQGLYFDRGYISAQAQEATALNSYTGRVDIIYSIEENKVSYVDKIFIRGNIKTKDVIIRRELRVHPGDRFDGDKLRRSKERLQNLGFFEEVNYDTEDTQAEDKKNLVVEVKESKTGTFSFGGGYSTVDSFVGFAEIEQNNFDWRNFPYFTGGGQNLKFRAQFGTISSGFDLSFTEPWLLDYPVSFGFDAYKRTHKRDTDVGYGYDQDTTGGDLRLGKEISEFLRLDLVYRYDRYNIKNITDNATDDLKQEAGRKSISSITPSFTFDTRDNVFDTKKGNLFTVSMEWAGGPWGANKDYWKFFGRASHYIPLLRNSSLEFRARAGLSKPYSDTQRVPIYERFFAGGAYTIRGYEERIVGPIDPVSKDPLGGESMLVGNIEYTYPVFSFLKVAAFYDVGNVWQKLNKTASGGFKSGAGIGVRIKSPIGPIMLDFGIPFNKAPGDDKRKGGRFHFSASQGF
ncbi:MAG: outer membrane protein assembly factor BamA [Candidatus Omnitrophota bacterium]|nr:outer membrane protein assembly factor BamA [Candidatus Omnitrophota bacterium]